MNIHKKSQKNVTAPPKILRRPMIPAAITILLDLLLIAAALIISRMDIPKTYTYENGMITAHSMTDFFGAAAAAVICISAGMSALIIASGVVRKRAEGNAAVFSAISRGAGLLAVSSALAVFAAFIVTGEKPAKVSYYGYTDSSSHILFAEEQYSRWNMLCIYDVDEDCGEAALLARTELAELSENDERYSMSNLSDNVLYVAFYDNGKYRTLQIEHEPLEQGGFAK